jgi:hypothetical protein
VGKAVPYSLYDTLANLGFVVVGITHETPAFVVRAIVLWWRECGRKMYPDTKELLILVDSGGGNGWRTRGWKYHLQYELCDPYGLTWGGESPGKTGLAWIVDICSIGDRILVAAWWLSYAEHN